MNQSASASSRSLLIRTSAVLDEVADMNWSNWSQNAQQQPRWGHRTMRFGRTKQRGDPVQEHIDCLVGSGTTVTGDLTFAGGLRIDGHVEGDVIVSSVNPGTLVIGDGGSVAGDVRVSHLIVFGRVLGAVYASGLVDLRISAQVAGDVHYGAIEIEKGAVVEGHLVKHKMAGAIQ
ncbi:polymer-forming cytoskeletal protein [uncultured Sphaerotilus sp.]|uniref:bactofilin family protein n=1 Tax=uncultured Sphaerotilus sp. TaxID=474984 RepID=UPI0030CA27D1